MNKTLNKIVMWFKQIGIFGVLRFKLIYLVCKFLPINSRCEEFDFVLRYLPKVKKNEYSVLDVGSTTSLFIYKLYESGYRTYGCDPRPYQERLPDDIRFINDDITNMKRYPFYSEFDFIVAVSTIEHFGTGEYGNAKNNQKQKEAIQNIAELLKPDGLFVFTLPEVHLQDGIGYRLYTECNVISLVSEYFSVEVIERHKGQWCVVAKKLKEVKDEMR